MFPFLMIPSWNSKCYHKEDILNCKSKVTVFYFGKFLLKFYLKKMKLIKFICEQIHQINLYNLLC